MNEEKKKELENCKQMLHSNNKGFQLLAIKYLQNICNWTVLNIALEFFNSGKGWEFQNTIFPHVSIYRKYFLGNQIDFFFKIEKGYLNSATFETKYNIMIISDFEYFLNIKYDDNTNFDLSDLKDLRSHFSRLIGTAIRCHEKGIPLEQYYTLPRYTYTLN